MILSARDLKVRGVLCALRFVRVVDFSMSHGGRSECGVASASGLPLSVALTGVCDGVDLAPPSIKRNLNICQGTVDDAVGLFQNITNATGSFHVKWADFQKSPRTSSSNLVQFF